MADLTNDQLDRLQFRRLHEDFVRTRVPGWISDWRWPDQPTGRASDADLFEQWLVERWLTEIRSEAFQRSVQFQQLRAEWEREG